MATVTGITPNFGAVGDSITITGTGFGASQGGSTVTVAGTSASVTSWSDTSIVITIPSISTGGRVVVTVSGSAQSDYKASWFELRDATVFSIYDTVNGRIKAQDETADSSPEDYRYADARDYNHLVHLIANFLEGAGKSAMTGLRLVYSSATAVILEAGSCADSTGKRLLTLPQTTLTITTQGVGGLDETTLTATATTNGTTAVTMSASIYSETPLSSTVRTLTGTLTSSGTAVTGSGTKFLSEVAIGDVIRSASNGASRVTAIASDTALTLVAAFPGGDVGVGQAITSHENLTLWPDTGSAGDKRRVNTISHAGTAVVLSSSVTSSASGRTARVGVEVASCWFFPWVVYGGSGTSAVLSTQRTRPYSASGYTTAWRQVAGIGVYNNASGNIDNFECRGEGNRRFVKWIDDSVHEIGTTLSSTSNVQLSTNTAAPPTATDVVLRVAIFNATFASTAGYVVLLISSMRDGGSTYNGAVGCHAGTTAATAGTNYSSGYPVGLTPSGGLIYKFVLGGVGALSGTPGYIYGMGYWCEG